MSRSLPLCLFATAFALTTTVHAQHDRFAYAITDLTREGGNWTALRRLDLQTGAYTNVLLHGMDEKVRVFDAATRKEVTRRDDPRHGNLLHLPFGTGVAAAAFDRRHNRLYFTPMFVDQLRYIDLHTMKIYYVSGQSFTGLGDMHSDEGKIVTRMAIAPNGTGYAITNDGRTVVRFSTGKKPKVEALGALVDDPENNGISIHNRCSSYGGDMIADDAGNLYILSARNHVFRVNTETRVARHLGVIAGLPANFTVNGAVVDASGALLVSSAVDGSAYYTVEPGSWKATAYAAAPSIFRSSDLANSNFLPTGKRPAELPLLATGSEKYSKLISVYPNPVTGNSLTLQFSKVPSGEYTVELTDALGRSVVQRRVTVATTEQVQPLTLDEGHAKGIYLLKVVDRDRLAVFTRKVMVQ